ncbi:MAG TPA: DUF3089 domain-containing protein [Methanocorpusculum sp.]|nr:DUF3089 domain-containing protein [Methanocorpusculum sp.]
MKIFHVLIAAALIACCILAAGCVQNTATQTVGTPKDYSNPDNWMIQSKNPVQAVDVFYLYPTVVLASTQENGVGELDENAKNSAKEVFMMQGSAFAEYCNVYAPYYRQIGSDKVVEVNSHDKIIEVMRNSEVKTDVFAALDYYFKNLNKGAERPFILAGHSQGSAALLIVLDEYMKQHPEYYKNMVAAYPIGFGVDQSWLDANPHLKFAEGRNDTGVIVSWNTEAPGGEKGNFVIGTNSQVINPLTWVRDESYADKSLNTGSIVITTEAKEIANGVYEYDEESTIKSGLHDAQIDKKRGALICTTADDLIMAENALFGDKALHGSDYSLYYENIRSNCIERIEAFLGYKPLTGIPLDYSLEKNWVFADTKPQHEVDLFYVYPTVDMESDKVVYSVSSELTEDDSGLQTLVISNRYVTFKDVSEVTPEVVEAAKGVFTTSGAAFEEYTNVFMPCYRQIPLDREVQTTTHDDVVEILRNSRARTDMFAALDYYFENFNKGAERPFILAGHSQGSEMIQVILDDYMKNHPEYYKNMVAAYVIGYGTEQKWLDANPHLKFATGETDTGVIISWNTEGPGATMYSQLVGTGSKVINPLNWKTDETYADKSLNKGSLVKKADGKYELVSGLHDAQVDNKRGALICTTDTNYLTNAGDIDVISSFGDKSLHGCDYTHYFANIKENGKKRIDAFLAKNK